MSNNDYKIELGVKLNQSDLNNIKNTLNGLAKDGIKIKIDSGSIQTNISSIAKQMQNSGSNAGENFARGFNSSISSIRTEANNSIDTIQHMRQVLAKAKFNNSSIEAVTRNLEEMNLEISNVTTRVGKRNLNISIKGIDELGRAVTIVKQFDYASGQVVNNGKTIAQSFDTSVDATKRFKKEVNNAFADVKKITQQIGNLEIDLIGAEAKNDVRDIENIKNRLVDLRDTLTSIYGVYGSHFSNRQYSSIQSINDDIGYKKIQAQNKVANQSDVNIAKELNNEMSKFVKLRTQIENMNVKIGNLEAIGGKTNQVAELRTQLENLEDTYARLMQTFMKKLNVNSDIMSTDDVARFNNEIASITQKTENELRELDAKIADTKAKLAKGIELKLNDGTFNNDISNIESKFNKLSIKSNDVEIGLKEVIQALVNMREAAKSGNIDELISANERYERALKSVNNQLQINARAERDAAATQKLDDDRESFKSGIDAWLTKNSAAAKKFGSQMLELKAQAESCDRTRLDHLKNEFKRLDNEAEAAGLKMQSFGDRIKTQFSKYRDYFSIASVFMYGSQAMRDMFEQVKSIDSAMTELKKVTDETESSYDKFLTDAASRAKEIGTTIDGLVNSTADFARLGYGFEDAQGLAEVANIYAVVGDEVEGVEGATESLISTMAAYKNEMNGLSNTDFAMGIIDKYNEIGNKFSITSGGIGEALERSASSLNAANNSMDESIALITAANTVVQDPDRVGNAFKTKN